MIAQPTNNLIKDVTMAAPNAAALGKYGDYSVGNFTGVPDIGIPIYTVQEGPLSLPVSLNYHASGIKVAEMSSWVGAGWSLNAGGIISRTIQGVRDEDFSRGYYNNGHTIATSINSGANDLDTRISNGELDGEPDIFSFNVGGYSGKFYIDYKNVGADKPKYQFIPKQDLKLEFDDGFLGFTIVTPDGTRYIFGRYQPTTGNAITAHEKTMYQDQPNGERYISSWYLLRVESHDKQFAVSLNYQDESYSYLSNASGKFIQYQLNASTIYSGCSSFTQEYVYSYNSNTEIDVNHRHFRTYVDGKRLSQIVSSTSTLNFVATTNRGDLDDNKGFTESGAGMAKYLNKIEIVTGDKCKKFDMNYDYFQDPGSTTKTCYKKLRLLNVTEKSCDETIINPPYSFTYNGNFLPHRLSKAVDHWGFYNGAIANESKEINIPPTTLTTWTGSSTTFGSSNRETNETEMKKGVLADITFPTGGKTTFAFEANTVPANVQSDPIQVFSIKTCPHPLNSACCGFPYSGGAYTMTTEDINSGKFTLQVTAIVNFSSTCTGMTPYDPAGYIYAYDAAWNYIGAYGFSLSNGQSNASVTLPLSYIAGFQANAIYNFQIFGTNSYSTFQITNQPIVAITKKVGGLRVKEIKSNDGVSVANDVLKTYDYSDINNSNLSSGKLLQSPKYGLYLPPASVLDPSNPTQYGNNGYATMLAFNDESIVPLYSFEGNHIGYNYVKEIHNGNGYKLYKYFAEPVISNNAYPTPPLDPKPSNGNIDAVKVYSQQGTVLQSTTNTPKAESMTFNSGSIRKAIRLPFSCQVLSGGNSTPITLFAILHTDYNLKTRPYRLESTTQMIDGVTTATSYTYNTDYTNYGTMPLPTLPLNLPLTTTMTNSENKITITRNKYITDPSVTSPAKAEMINRNIIANPVETTVEVANVVTNGSKTTFNLFNGNPYPQEFWKYKMSWDANGTAQTLGWEKEGTITGYNSKGQPTSFTQRGWEANPETYTWNPTNGLIATRTFKDFVWQYKYFPNTRLVQKITNIDGQFTTFTYDHFQRLKTSSARGGAVTTANTYKYKDGSNADKNWIETKISFTAAIGGPLSNNTTYKTVRQYFDGLGRPIQSVAVANSPNGKDVVSAVAYDNQGREAFKYEPIESTFSNGNFVTPTGLTTALEYEQSPLNRIWKVTPPGWQPTYTTYGTNTDFEAYDMTGAGYYAVNTLHKVTVQDPDGRVSKSYTDRKGRKVFTMQTQNNVVGGTYMIYQFDDKDRLVKALTPRNVWQEWFYAPDLDFKYVYDWNDNMTQKFVPDAARVDMMYNVRNQLVLVQDGNLRAFSNRYLSTQYDDYGRPTASGFTFSNVIDPITGNPYVSFHNSTTEYSTTPGVELGKVKRTKSLASGPILETFLEYDNFGRLKNSYSNSHINLLSGTTISPTNFSEKIELNYDLADNVLSKIRTHKPNSTTTNVITESTDYDNGLRPKQVRHKIDAMTEQILSSMDYTIKNQVSTKWMGKPVNYSGNYLQKVDYSYNTLGWLTGINSPATAMSLGLPSPLVNCNVPFSFPANATDLDKNDLFSMDLKYEAPVAAYAPSGTTTTPQYGGNISQVVWEVRGRERQAYTFQYDHINRMTVAAYSDINTGGSVTASNRFDERVEYDVRGNIKHLQRNGLTSSCGWGAIDDLYYHHGSTYGQNMTNKLQKVIDNADLTKGFKTASNGSTYTYDANGNLKSDPNKGITSITYNHLNLPLVITFTNNRTITFVYDVSGNKLSKTVAQNYGILYVQDYVGGIEYRSVSGVRTLEAIYHSEGRVTNINGGLKYEYTLKDHLGTTRMMFSDKDGNGLIVQNANQETSEVTQENHVYPFGLAMEGVWANSLSVTDNKYQLTGKELNSDFGLEWSDFGARMYDAAIGKWNAIDPMADAYTSWSPYNYTLGNPANFIDPDGMGVEGSPQSWGQTFKGAAFVDENGNMSGNSSNDNNSGDKKKYSNLYIIITSPKEQALRYKDSGPMGTFDVKIFYDLLDAAKWVAKNYSKGELDNIVLDAHGNKGWITVRIDNQSEPMALKSARDLRGADVDNPSEATQKDLNAMQMIMSRIRNGGKFAVLSCDAGYGKNGTALLGKLHELNTKVDIYLNQDPSGVTSNGQIQIWNRMGLGSDENNTFQYGWKKQGPSTAGVMIKLINQPNLTGDIYLDSRKGKKAINEIIKK